MHLVCLRVMHDNGSALAFFENVDSPRDTACFGHDIPKRGLPLGLDEHSRRRVLCTRRCWMGSRRNTVETQARTGIEFTPRQAADGVGRIVAIHGPISFPG